MPTKAGRFPVVLVAHEIFGVNLQIQDACRRLADIGYLAAAPDLFARQGNVASFRTADELISGLVSQVPDAQALSDLDQTAAWVASMGKGDMSRLQMTGFSWGGRLTWLYAAHSTQLRSAVVWYGKLVGETTALQPRQPVDVAGGLNCPVLGMYGAKDPGIPVDTVERMQKAAQEAGKRVEVAMYPEAGHGFNAECNPGYNAIVAQDAWDRIP